MDRKYRICGLLPVKLLAMLLLICSCFATVASGVAIAGFESLSVYTNDKEETLRRYNINNLSKYSVGAVIDHEHSYRYEELKNTNFRYGVMKNVDIETVDIADLSNYEFCNFDNRFEKLSKDRENFNIYSCNFDNNSDFYYNPTLLGSAWIYNSAEETACSVPMTGALYDWQSGCLYLTDGKRLYLYENEIELSDSDENGGMVYCGTFREMTETYSVNMTEGDVTWPPFSERAVITLMDSGYKIKLSDIRIVTSTAELLNYGELSEDDYSIDPRGFLRTTQYSVNTGDAYYVVSYVAEPLAMGKSFAACDLFGQAKLLVDLAYQWRYMIVVIFFAALLVDLACFVFLCGAAGRRSGTEELQGHVWDKMPLDLSFVLAMAIDVCLLVGAALCICETIGDDLMQYKRVLPWLVTGICGMLSVVLAMGWFMSLAYHVKKKDALTHNLTYKILRGSKHLAKKCIEIVKSFVSYFRNGIRDFFDHLKLYTFGLLAVGVLLGLELMCMFFTYEQLEAGIIFWLLLSVVEVFFALKLIRQLQELKDAGKKLAAGELDYRMKAERMLPQLREHAKNLNAIGEGMNTAVEQRMKSERFKTELITNVSHDIKTPLTSIINYVDLLGKEEFDNSTAREYLEVLERQSGKLKKLIEDLIEASKASTGNLAVAMTQLDVSVVMAQVIGEFEEKLAASQINLQVQTPAQPVPILADSNHLWRVFDNLLNNICKYAQPGTRTYVNLEHRGDQEAVIIFRNISREALNISSDELMERFVRADSSRHTEGNGLGLSIAKNLMELMDGRMKLTIDGDLFKVELSFHVC